MRHESSVRPGPEQQENANLLRRAKLAYYKGRIENASELESIAKGKRPPLDRTGHLEGRWSSSYRCG